MNQVCYQVLAVKYATVHRARSRTFLNPASGEPKAPMALDFFVWLIHGPGGAVLVDTGFSSASALARGRRSVSNGETK